MKIIDKIKSTEDKVVKYVLQMNDGVISEVSYIDNNTNKDIICCSTHSGCQLGCRFCFLTDFCHKIKVRPLSGWETFETIAKVYMEEELYKNKRMLLVSYMGCGEPLLSWEKVLDSMLFVKNRLTDQPSRFAIATLLPKHCWNNYFNFIHSIFQNKLPVKIHLSLHFTENEKRKEWMPAALDIDPAIAALKFYKDMGGQTEVHYAMVEGVNDTKADAFTLATLWQEYGIDIKLMEYNRKESLEYNTSCEKRLKIFTDILDESGVKWEYYRPPGISIGSSCGSFMQEYYLKYNAKE